MAAIQDTFFGHLLRFVAHCQVLAWPEQVDQNLANVYLSHQSTEKSNAPLYDSNSRDSDRNKQLAKSKSCIIIDWLPEDTENPQNWTSTKKALVSAQICLLTTSVYIGASIYTVGLLSIQEQFRASQTVALLGLTLFIIGYGIGPMILAPLSEMPSIGRSPVYILTLAMFVVLQPCIIYAKNIGMLLAFRFITGVFGSPALALGGATAADMYTPQKLPYAISLWGAAAAFGPALGPVIASYAAQYRGWTWPIWELMWLSGLCLVILFCFLPETLAANILHRRAQRLEAIVNRNNPNSHISVKSVPDLVHEGIDGAKQGREILTGVFTLSFSEPLILILNLYISLVYAILYLWFESFPIVFIGIYHFSLGNLGLAFIGIFIGTLITVPIYWIYLRLRFEPPFTDATKCHKLQPEIYMEPAFVGCFFLPASMFLFAWTSRASVHWSVPICATILFPIGAFPLFMAVLGYLSAAYPKHIASVFGGNDLMRSAFGAGFPLSANALFKTPGIDWANTLLALLAALFIPVPFVLAKYGSTIRKMSRRAVQDEE